MPGKDSEHTLVTKSVRSDPIRGVAALPEVQSESLQVTADVSGSSYRLGLTHFHGDDEALQQ